MVRKICRESFVPSLAVGIAVAALACNNQNEPDSNSTMMKRSAVTASAAAGAVINYRENDFGRPPSNLPPLPPAQPPAVSPSPPLAVPASQHPGHLSNKVVNKPAARAGAGAPMSPAPTAEYRTKQAAYLQQLQQLEPSIAGRPAEEQELRRAALKHSVLGQ
jgi:hypothetical protein